MDKIVDQSQYKYMVFLRPKRHSQSYFTRKRRNKIRKRKRKQTLKIIQRLSGMKWTSVLEVKQLNPNAVFQVD